jgi:hypothetical protein
MSFSKNACGKRGEIRRSAESEGCAERSAASIAQVEDCGRHHDSAIIAKRIRVSHDNTQAGRPERAATAGR